MLPWLASLLPFCPPSAMKRVRHVSKLRHGWRWPEINLQPKQSHPGNPKLLEREKKVLFLTSFWGSGFVIIVTQHCYTKILLKHTISRKLSVSPLLSKWKHQYPPPQNLATQVSLTLKNPRVCWSSSADPDWACLGEAAPAGSRWVGLSVTAGLCTG